MWTLRQVYAKNLCAFKQLDYTLLQKHTTLIFGNNMDNDSQGSNGSGKSAMLEAIAIGITGETLRRIKMDEIINDCLLYTSPSPRDVEESRMPSSA